MRSRRIIGSCDRRPRRDPPSCAGSQVRRAPPPTLLAAEVSTGIAHARSAGRRSIPPTAGIVSTLCRQETRATSTAVAGGDTIMASPTQHARGVRSGPNRRHGVRPDSRPRRMRCTRSRDHSAATTTVAALGIVQYSAGNFRRYVHPPEGDHATPVDRWRFDTATAVGRLHALQGVPVKEMLVEVDKGTVSGATSAARAVGAYVLTLPDRRRGGRRQLARTQGPPFRRLLSPLTIRMPATAMVRFRANDAGPIFRPSPSSTCVASSCVGSSWSVRT